MLVCVILFFDVQAFLTEGLFEAFRQKTHGISDWLTTTVQALAAIAVPVAGVVLTFRQQIGDLLKAASTEASRSTKTLAYLSRIAIWIAGAALPLLVLVLYTYLRYWGIINDLTQEPPAAAQATLAEKGEKKRFAPKVVADTSREPEKQACGVPAGRETYPCCAYLRDREIPDAMHTPQWLMNGGSYLANALLCPLVQPLAVAEGKRVDAEIRKLPAATRSAIEKNRDLEPWQPMRWLFEHTVYRPMAVLYLFAGALLAIIALLLRPNTNSLHGLYRDRLSKAFLFEPPPEASEASRPEDVERETASLDQGRDFPQLDDKKISWLSPVHAPYHLINAALNIQGSDYANRRGRNADFFLFSPRYVGSDATGYARTDEFEKVAPDLTLATAMAISGAAVSSNMGSEFGWRSARYAGAAQCPARLLAEKSALCVGRAATALAHRLVDLLVPGGPKSWVASTRTAWMST